MENNNPLSPHIQIYRWHISSLVSISHRITGIINNIRILYSNRKPETGTIDLSAIIKGIVKEFTDEWERLHDLSLPLNPSEADE